MIRVTVMAGEGVFSVFDHDLWEYSIRENGILDLRAEKGSVPVVSYNAMAWLKVEDVEVPSS